MAALFVWLIASVFLGLGPVPPIVAFLVFTTWASLYLQDQSLVMSTLLWGGIISIVGDRQGNLALVAGIVPANEATNIGVVEASVPGILRVYPSKLTRVKPIDLWGEVDWTMNAIVRAIGKNRVYARD